MAVTAGQVVVSTTAVALNGADTGVSGARLIVKNSHATDALILGASDVTTSTGFSLAAGATLTVELTAGEQLYAVRGAAADITAHVLRIGM
jgi:hypothetical protein